jgi:hypothetical protein
MAHTPGPWEYGVNPAGEYSNGVVVRPAGEFPHGLWIADCGSEYDAERHDNARLIAAAPDLLEACREIVRWHGIRSDSDELLHRDAQQPEIAAAMDAIAKATGTP